MGMVGGGIGMQRAQMMGFEDKKLASLKIVHDCTLRQKLMRRGIANLSLQTALGLMVICVISYKFTISVFMFLTIFCD